MMMTMFVQIARETDNNVLCPIKDNFATRKMLIVMNCHDVC